MKNRKLFAIITLVAFMLTMMPVMAFGVGTFTTAGSAVLAVKDSVLANGTAELEYDLYLDGNIGAKTLAIYVTRNGSYSMSETITVKNGDDVVGDSWAAASEFINESDMATGAYKVYVKSNTTGAIKLNVVYLRGTTTDASINGVVGGSSNYMTMPLEGSGVAGTFRPLAAGKTTVDVTVNDGTNSDTFANNDGSDKIDTYNNVTKIAANNGVSKYTVGVTLKQGGTALKGEKLAVSVNKNGAGVNKTEVETNVLGKASFNVFASKADKYIVTVTYGDFSQDIELEFTGTKAATASFSSVTTDTIATGVAKTAALVVKTVDALGNAVDYDGTTFDVKVVAAPEDSTLEDSVLGGGALTMADVTDGKISFTPDVAGTYTIKVINKDTGVADTATIKAADFGKVDHITVAYAASSFNLGSTTGKAIVNAVDTNGVVKSLSSAAVNYSYAGVGVVSVSNEGAVTFQSQSVYAGQQIVVTAVYNGKYIASTTLTIGVKPATINFTEATGAAKSDITVKGQLVDLNGNAVVENLTTATVQSTVVIAQPEGAKVYVDDSDFDKNNNEFKNKGVATFKVYSDKEGIVKVNVIVAMDPVSGDDYYVAGTATVNVGGVEVEKAPVESVVNMIIGANTVIADGKASASPVAPFIENGRTFVPVRAFAEATGATVNYDAATQVITIKATGVDAQMTVGSNVMTVNGETVVMDAAAKVIGEGYTVLPVRYAGQALGYSFDVAYGANGAVTAVTMTK